MLLVFWSQKLPTVQVGFEASPRHPLGMAFLPGADGGAKLPALVAPSEAFGFWVAKASENGSKLSGRRLS